jgi:hypothetical protein
MAKASAYSQRKFGPEAWNFIYIFLGFVLSIEGTFIQMFYLDPVESVTLYALIIVLTVSLFLDSRRFQDMLMRLRGSYEEKWR